MNRNNLFFIVLTGFVLSSCAPNFEREITVPELESIVSFLSSDSLKGRYPGTAEDLALTQYIVDKLDEAGLVLMADDGRQAFDVEQGYSVGEHNMLRFDGQEVAFSATGGFLPLGFSETDTVEAAVVRYTEVADALNDPEGIAGNWVAVPLPADLPVFAYDAFMVLRDLSLQLSDKDAAGVLFVAEAAGHTLPAVSHSKRLTLPVPVIMVSAELIDMIAAGAAAGDLPVLEASSEILPEKITTYNTIAHLRGSDPDVRDQYVIIGAHHDHLGSGGRGSSSRMQDTIAYHYGADDNASGVAGVIQIAEKVMSESPDRSYVFVTFGAEEMGILGSKYFASHPTLDLDRAQVMINMDMLGRLNEHRQLQIGGVGTSPLFRPIIDSLNTAYAFSIKYSEAGYGPSDHSSFYAEDVPVLFISTGAHTDYHTPFDTEDKIDYEGMVDVLNFVSDIALELGNMEDTLQFTMAGPKTPSRPRSGYGKVTLGLMPDVTAEGNDGMPVSFVTEGKPAAAGGMKGGDIIVAVDGKRVGNVYDYMARLGDLKPGQSLIVKVIRDGEEVELLIQL